MIFKDIENNEFLVERISKLILKENISHAYIFSGATGRDRILAADLFSKAVLCREFPGSGCDSCIICKKIDHGNHEDLIYIEKDENSIKDEAIEELQKKLKRKPFAGDRIIAVIKDADTMTSRAQNRLLKTLEEPFPGTVLILLADNEENLMRTVLSRCANLRWNSFSEDNVEIAEKAEEFVRKLVDGEPYYLKKKVLSSVENRDEAYRLLDSMEVIFGSYIRKSTYSKEMLKTAIDSIEGARSELARGMQPMQSLKRMILKMEDV